MNEKQDNTFNFLLKSSQIDGGLEGLRWLLVQNSSMEMVMRIDIGYFRWLMRIKDDQTKLIINSFLINYLRL